jgi:hypothetical protein
MNSNRLVGGEYTRKLFTNTNNTKNICKNLKSFLGMSIGARRSSRMKISGAETSPNTVPLIRKY